MILRVLGAFGWLRWRILLNSLERRGSRDVIERLSGAFEQLVPVIAAVVMIPSVLALAAAGAFAGWSLGHGEGRVYLFDVLRVLLFGASVVAIVGPILLPAGERTNAVRLLLLPIPRALLYVAQSMSALADPWIVLAGAVVLAIPVGLAAAGAVQGAALALLGGVLLLGALTGLALLVTSVMHMVVRNRRRGEMLTLIVVLVLPALALLPSLLGGERQRARTNRDAAQSQPAPRDGGPPAWWTTIERAGRAVAPSELYAAAARAASDARYREAAIPLAALAAGTLVLHALAFAAFVHLWGSPGVIGAGQARAGARTVMWQLPGLAPETSAIALNQLRLALRTPRGRSIVLSPAIVFAMFAAMMWRGQTGMQFGFISLESGLGLAAFGSFVALISILPFAMNQFAIDRAGLTLVMLGPVDTPSLLRGKAIGNALIAAIPATFCILASLALFPGGHPALWLSVPLGLTAIYLLASPAAAALSAMFPRAVDLNSIGRGSNAHGAAGLLGTLIFFAAGVPVLLLTLLATRGVERPALAPVFLLVWAAMCAGIAILLFRGAAALFESRRENLGMVK